MSTGRQPNMIILAGPNGSGKTTFATLLAQHDWGKGCININADDLAQQLGSWEKVGGGIWQAESPGYGNRQANASRIPEPGAIKAGAVLVTLL